LKKSGGIFDLPRKTSRVAELENLASQPSFWEQPQKAQELSREMTRIKEDLQFFQSLEQSLKDLREFSEMAQDSDEAMWKDLETSQETLDAKIHKAEREAKLSQPTDRDDALMTIHAGAGGTEACDWAEMLTRMFQRYCERKGFTVEMTDILMGDQAGIKSITFFVRGPFAYGLLKGEAGVHRLVRISPFDANKRRHTSFASVDVLPDIQNEVEIEIKDGDLRIDTYRAHGAGGQHINKTDSAVRITHLPTGVVVACQNQRSQIKNREKAMQVLKIRLYEREQEKQRAAMEKRYDEKGDIAWGNQIRSYVFMPYQLVKDHRTGHEYSQVEKVMDGELDAFIDAYLEKGANARVG
jgi:peptide chain release factor 2